MKHEVRFQGVSFRKYEILGRACEHLNAKARGEGQCWMLQRQDAGLLFYDWTSTVQLVTTHGAQCILRSNQATMKVQSGTGAHCYCTLCR